MNQDYEMWDMDQLLEPYVDNPELAENVKIKLETLFLCLEKKCFIKLPHKRRKWTGNHTINQEKRIN